jgi:protein ImuB
VERAGSALRLAAVSAQAGRFGLMVGMTLADARARCPDLATAAHDPGADARLLDRLAAGMVRFTPRVAVAGTDTLLLDITGCGHLFGGDAALARLAVEQAAGAGLTPRHALAPHGAGARALARFGGPGGQIADLPIAALDVGDEVLRGLRRAGLRRLGDLAARPMAGLAARFGEGVVTALRHLLGEGARPIAPRHRPAPIRATARFAHPIARTDDVLEVIEDLLGQATRQMEARQIGGRRFIVTLDRADHARRDLCIDTSQPLREAAPVMRLMRERIETLADPLDPGFGFDAVHLAVPRTGPLPARQTAIDGPPAEDTLAALIDRLSTRLGAQAVLRLHPRDTHSPERAQVLRPALHHAPASWPPPPANPRPLTLLSPPQPITAIAGVPDGPPQRFTWRGQTHTITRAEGPERIAAEWWRQPLDHLPGYAAPTRDYYRVEDKEGRRFWVFRHGLFDEQAHPRWYLHGLFP